MHNNVIFYTKYGTFKIPKNDKIILGGFISGKHWGQDEIDFVCSLIDRDKNILEYGSHVGTHTIPYAKFIDNNSTVYSFEPQTNIFEILSDNIRINNVAEKVIHKNASLFYFTGQVRMNSEFIDGHFLGSVAEANLSGVDCNYGGLTLGSDGQLVDCYKMDDLKLENLGFIHSDAQGCDNIIFWGGRETISKFKPIILYEDSNFEIITESLGKNIYRETITNSYDIPEEVLSFDISKFCVEELGYRTYQKGLNSYLIP